MNFLLLSSHFACTSCIEEHTDRWQTNVAYIYSFSVLLHRIPSRSHVGQILPQLSEQHRQLNRPAVCDIWLSLWLCWCHSFLPSFIIQSVHYKTISTTYVVKPKILHNLVHVLLSYLKLCHPHCVKSIIQSCSVCISIYIHTVMNTTILQLVAIYNIQLHVSVLYVGHHQVVQRTY